MTMALAVAMVACSGAVGQPGEPGQPGEAGAPGQPGESATHRPVVEEMIPDVPSLMVEDTTTVDLNVVFTEPEDEALTFTATPADVTIATAVVGAEGILTVTGVAVGDTKVTVIAKDPGGLQARQTFDVTVTAKAPEPDPPVTIDDVRDMYPRLTITPTTAADVSKEIELPADHTLMSEDPTIVTVAAAASAPATSIRWASATDATTMTKNMWVVSAVSKGVTDVDVLDKTDASVHVIRVSVTTNLPATLAPVAKKGSITTQTVVVGTPGTVALADYFTVGESNAPLKYAPASSKDSIATVAEASGVLTITGVAAGTSEITVTATDAGKNTAMQKFMVTVTPDPTAAPVAKKGSIPTQTVVVGTPGTVALADYFTVGESNAPLKYAPASSKDSIATVAEASGVLTITGVAAGTSEITVTATDAGKSTAMQKFMVTVTEPASVKPPTMFTISDTKAITINAAHYVPDGADAADYYLEPVTYDFVDVVLKLGSTTMWTVTPKSEGTTEIAIKEIATGNAIDVKITVAVKNRSPIRKLDAVDPTVKRLGDPVVTKVETKNADGTMLKLHNAMFALKDQFEEPDMVQQLTFVVRSSHGDVLVVRKPGDCSLAKGCNIDVDFVRKPPRVDEFQLLVQAKDKAGLLSPVVRFPFWDAYCSGGADL